MNTQPVEILCVILNKLSNLELNKCRGVCSKWKNLIEKTILYSQNPPSKRDCIILADYYHFRTYKKEVITITEYLICRKLAELKNDSIFLKYFGKPRFITLIPSTSHREASLNVQLPPSIIDLFNEIIRNGDLETARYFIQSAHPDLVSSTHYKENALINSITSGHILIIQLLIEKGANIHYNSERAFICAAEKGNLEIGNLLLKNNVDTSVVLKQLGNLSMRSQCMIVKFMIELNLKIVYDKTILLTNSIADLQDIDLVKFFSKQGADILLVDIRRLQDTAKHNEKFIKQLLDLELLY